MKVDIIERNYEMSAKLEEIILKKTQRLSKYFDESTTVRILLKKEDDIYKMEITVHFNATVIRSEINGENMYDNIDLLLPKIEKQVVKNKEKLQKKLKDNAFKDKQYLYMPSLPQDKPVKLVKTKKFTVSRRTVDEAIRDMHMLDHDFYLYLDDESGEMRVLYRRTDGNVGLLVPQIED